MEPRVFEGSRLKAGLCVGAALILLAVFAGVRQGGAFDLFGFVLLAAVAAISIWQFLSPQQLLLDAEGFRLAHGTRRATRKIPWAEIETFYVTRPVRLVTMIGYRRSGSGDSRSTEAFSGNPALPGGWRESNEAIAAELNAYRERALRAGP